MSLLRGVHRQCQVLAETGGLVLAQLVCPVERPWRVQHVTRCVGRNDLIFRDSGHTELERLIRALWITLLHAVSVEVTFPNETVVTSTLLAAGLFASKVTTADPPGRIAGLLAMWTDNVIV